MTTCWSFEGEKDSAVIFTQKSAAKVTNTGGEKDDLIYLKVQISDYWELLTSVTDLNYCDAREQSEMN